MKSSPASPLMDKDPLTVYVPREFHRRMAANIGAVQTGMWEAGLSLATLLTRVAIKRE